MCLLHERDIDTWLIPPSSCLAEHRIVKTEVLSGAPLHLNCSLPSLPPDCAAVSADRSAVYDRVVWRFTPAASSRGIGIDGVTVTLDLDAPSSDFILTRDGGLIALSIRMEHAGVFVCSLGGRTVAQHEVAVLRKSFCAGRYVQFNVYGFLFLYLFFYNLRSKNLNYYSYSFLFYFFHPGMYKSRGLKT